MATRANGPAAGWSWLWRGINTGRHQPITVFSAALLLLVFALIPSAVQLVVQLTIRPGPTGMLAMFGAMMLIAAVLYPLLFAGYLRILDASENGRPARVAMLFEPFRAGRGGGRLVVFGLCLMLVYVAVLALVLVAVGRSVLAWYMQVLSLGVAGATGAVLPALPAGFGMTIGLLMVFGLFYGGVYVIGLGQVALRGHAPLQALRDGLAGTLKNLLPLLVLTICMLVALILFVIVFSLLGALLMFLAGLVSKVLMFVLLVPLYVALMLVMYVVMLGVMYAIWEDVAGGESHNPATITSGVEA